MLCNPKEIVDFNVDTGTLDQNTYARIQSIIRKKKPKECNFDSIELNELEIEIIRHLNELEETIQKSATELSPALIVNYVYDLVKLYNSFYQNHAILKAETEDIKNFRLFLSQCTSLVIKNCL